MYEEIVSNCENLLRSGKDHRVAKILGGLNSAQVPRKWRLALANISRRASLISLGLRLLTPVVRRRRSSFEGPPTLGESAEYAILLQRCGAVQEAVTLLNGIDPRSEPSTLLYRAFCHFNLWEYESALPLLKAYLETPLDLYQEAIARVNLGAALVATDRHAEAESLLRDTIGFCRRGEFTRLIGNSQELLSQVFLFTDRIDEAEAVLNEAQAIFVAPHSLERLLTEKCSAFANAKRQSSIQPLLEFRRRAETWPHPETVRETDLFSLLVEPNEAILAKLFFGTPYEGYRSRMARVVGKLPESQTYTLGPEPSPSLDIVSGQCEGGPCLDPGSLTHQTLEALARDFYRPAPAGRLFSTIFPDEHFNVFTSPTRIRQVLRRTRKWLRDNQVPIAVVESRSAYSLQFNGDFSLRVPRERVSVSAENLLLERLLRELPPDTPVSARNIAETLKMSRPATQRFLAKSSVQKVIEKFGAGAATRYYVRGNSAKKSAG